MARNNSAGSCTNAFFSFLLVGGIAAVVVALTVFSNPVDCNTVEALTRAEQAVCRATSSKGTIEVSQSSTASRCATYIFSSQPRVLSTTVPVNRSATFRVYDDDWKYYSFVLVHGSIIDYNIEVEDALSFNLLTGAQYDRFRTGKSFSYIVSGGGTRFTGSFVASDDDEYFFVVENTRYSSVRGNWTFKIDYRRYDLSGYVDVCDGVSSCRFTGLSSRTYVITSASTTLSLTSDVDVEQKLRYNSSVRTGVLVGVPLGCLFIAGVPTYFHLRKEKRKKEAAAAAIATAESLTSGSSPALRAMLSHKTPAAATSTPGEEPVAVDPVMYPDGMPPPGTLAAAETMPTPAVAAGLPPPPPPPPEYSSLQQISEPSLPPTMPVAAYPTSFPPSQPSPAYDPNEYPDPDKIFGN